MYRKGVLALLVQELVEMEMLMARAEAERAALERELRAMRCTASEAASHLHLAEEELRVRPGYATWMIFCISSPQLRCPRNGAAACALS